MGKKKSNLQSILNLIPKELQSEPWVLELESELESHFDNVLLLNENHPNTLRELYHHVVKFSSNLMHSSEDKIEKDVNNALQTLGEFTQVDRVYIFEVNHKNNTINNTFEWCNEAISPEILNLQNIPISVIDNWVAKFEKNEKVYIPDVEQLKISDVKSILQAQSIISLLIVPVYFSEKFVAFGGFDSVKVKKFWSNEFTALLEIAMNIIVSNIFRIKHESLIAKSLKEKDSLLGEVHHRVKNNLSLIDGVLELNKFQTEDEQLIKILTETQSKIKSIGLVHQKLYQSDDFSSVCMTSYIKEIIEYYKDIYGGNIHSFEYKLELQDVKLNISSAICMGIIISEMLNNSCKYGLSPDQVLRLEIELSQEGGKNCIFKFKDNGFKKFGKDDFDDSSSFGIQLMKDMILQLRANLSLTWSNGVQYELKFKID